MGERSIADYCLSKASSASWLILPLGMAAGPRALGAIAELSKAGSAPAIVALGLMGDPVSVPLLISLLTQENAATPASLALECLTGAGMYETVFVPDDVHEDELFDSEIEQIKQGKPLDRGDGRPFGSNVTRISQQAEVWNKWWHSNGSRFTPGRRYRSGGPFSPDRLVETLAAERTPHQIRQYCAEELAIRYFKDFSIETDMPVRGQTVRLAEAFAWTKSGNLDFEEGGWYFGGYQT